MQKNKFREFLSVNGVGWSRDSVEKYGPSLIDTISNCMWYIDGHHETLSRQGCGVPAELQHLQNYNKPEQHGHKRKSETSLSSQTLRTHALAISSALAHAYMQKESWTVIRLVLEKLSCQLSKYTAYLDKELEQTTNAQARTSVSSDDDHMLVMDAKRSLNSSITARLHFFTMVKQVKGRHF